MRWLLWILLLVNVALLAYFRLTPAEQAENPAGHEALAPGQLKILTPEEVQQLPPPEPASGELPGQTPEQGQASLSPVSATQPAALACYEWGSFAGADALRAKAGLDRLSLTAVALPQGEAGASHYWVFIPPRRNQTEAQAKIAELRALGVTESYIVQEPAWRYAISLGVFKEESVAARFLDELKGRGVRSALMGPRGQNAQMRYAVRNAALTQMDELKGEFPGSELKQVDCP